MYIYKRNCCKERRVIYCREGVMVANKVVEVGVGVWFRAGLSSVVVQVV